MTEQLVLFDGYSRPEKPMVSPEALTTASAAVRALREVISVAWADHDYPGVLEGFEAYDKKIPKPKKIK